MAIINKTVIICVLLFSAVFLSRIFITEKYQSHWDGPQYSIAIYHYSIKNQTPAAPGYPIYIGIGKFLNIFFQNPHYSLIIESVVFSSIGIVIIYAFGNLLGGMKVALTSASLYITSPVIYFFGLTAYSYGIDAVLYLIFAYLIYKIYISKKDKSVALGVCLSLLIGFRPQDLLYIWPLALLGFLNLKKTSMNIFLFTFFVACLFWFIPLINASGGLKSYLALIKSGTQIADVNYLKHAIEVMPVIIKGGFLTLGFAPFLLLFFVVLNVKKLKKFIKKKRKEVIYFVIWIVPPFLFNLFIRSDHAGYQLSYLIPILLLSSLGIVNLFKKNNLVLIIIILFICLTNLYTFFRDRDPSYKYPYIPTSFHYSEIRKNDIKMGAKIDYIKKHLKPTNTVILIGKSDYIRPVMYYLPDFQILQFDRLFTKDMKYIDFVRNAKDYHLFEYKKNINEFLTSPAITKILCFDDECRNWVSSAASIINLKGNSSITIIDTNDHKLIYNYHSLKIN